MMEAVEKRGRISGGSIEGVNGDSGKGFEIKVTGV